MDLSNLSGILSDPEAIKNISDLAQMLQDGINDSGETTESNENSANSETGFGDIFGDIDLGQILTLVSLFTDPPKDKNVDFLLALSPLLSEERRPKVQRAVKLLKMYDLYITLKESGMLENIGKII
ncbi:MAG: hypothetical protein LBM87_05590 [Ruminococcus sp.]|nr:hypothetical protein [Ruminococcus sp.]